MANETDKKGINKEQAIFPVHCTILRIWVVAVQNHDTVTDSQIAGVVGMSFSKIPFIRLRTVNTQLIVLLQRHD